MTTSVARRTRPARYVALFCGLALCLTAGATGTAAAGPAGPRALRAPSPATAGPVATGTAARPHGTPAGGPRQVHDAHHRAHRRPHRPTAPAAAQRADAGRAADPVATPAAASAATPALRAGTVPATRSTAAARYWTAARMAAARPGDLVAVPAATGGGAGTKTRSRFVPNGLDVLTVRRLAPGRQTPRLADPGDPWVRGSAVTRTTGKVFFSIGAADYVCSGSAIASADQSSVLTAGHCVYDNGIDGTTPTGYVHNWAFVPGYTDGSAPYGIFGATHLATTSQWVAAGPAAFDDDLGIANVGRDARGRTLLQVVGGQHVLFSAARGLPVVALGYPAEPPFTGEVLWSCSGILAPDTHGPGSDQGLGCSMTGGSSGGPWINGLDLRTGRGWVVSVTSFFYTDLPGHLFGPYLGPVARRLYDSVAGTATR